MRWFLVLVAVIAVALSGCSTAILKAASRVATTTGTTAAMSLSHCGNGWTRGSSGAVQVMVHNVDSAAGEVYLADAAGRILAEADPVGAGSWGSLTAVLAPGRYHLVCAMDDADPVAGPTVSVTGTSVTGTSVTGTSVTGPTTAAGPAVQPITSGQLAPYAIADSRQMTARVGGLRVSVASLVVALDTGDRGAAEHAWLKAYRTWSALGVAYGAFGGLADAIAGLPYGLARGTADSGWTGFHRIEFGLWHGQPVASLRSLGAALQTNVAALGQALLVTQLDPGDMVRRTHEITEQIVQETLTGADDFGSDATTQAVAARLAATQELLTDLRPVLAARYPQLAATESVLRTSQSAAADIPSWKSAGRSQRERLDSELSQLCELLAPVATVLEPRMAP